ncbi:MAG TPA: methyltransferase domain-containing protein [Sorangium sp.]|nr:methyltransferase domain-containing protein [Sorangium sp.]
MMGAAMTASESAIYDSLVVSRYIQSFGAAAVRTLMPCPQAAVVHLGCRTGYPAEAISHHLPGCSLTGVDSSHAALELARTKASLISGLRTQYLHAEGFPTRLPSGQFSHSFVLHPLSHGGDYSAVLREQYRLLMPGGQMVLGLPLRGSFPELYDMLREYALRHDRPHFGEAVDAATSRRPNPETIVEQLERVGFSEVDVGVELVAITFENGRDFLDDPIARLVVGPDVRVSIAGQQGTDEAMAYVTDAIARYWSELTFELTVNIGSISARKL